MAFAVQMGTINPQFLGQALGRSSLQNAAHYQYDFPARIPATTPDGIREDVEHLATDAAFVVQKRGPVSVVRGLVFG